jgi:hypothetical protein
VVERITGFEEPTPTAVPGESHRVLSLSKDRKLG